MHILRILFVTFILQLPSVTQVQFSSAPSAGNPHQIYFSSPHCQQPLAAVAPMSTHTWGIYVCVYLSSLESLCIYKVGFIWTNWRNISSERISRIFWSFDKVKEHLRTVIKCKGKAILIAVNPLKISKTLIFHSSRITETKSIYIHSPPNSLFSE